MQTENKLTKIYLYTITMNMILSSYSLRKGAAIFVRFRTFKKYDLLTSLKKTFSSLLGISAVKFIFSLRISQFFIWHYFLYI